MKSKSIKTRLIYLTCILTVILIILLVPISIYAQLHLQHQAQKESSKQMFGQFIQLIEANNETLKQEQLLFEQHCIQAAEVVAHFVEHCSTNVEDVQHAQVLADKIGVDEIHYFTPQGEIFAGTHPKYYGFTFHSGEQMAYFLPMLSDHSLKLYQGITPNTAEGKNMIYAAVWLNDGSGIVQIGMEPKHLLNLMEEQSLKNILKNMPFDFGGHMHIINKNTMEIEASTKESLIGQNLTEQTERKNLLQFLKGEEHVTYNRTRYCIFTQEYGDYLLLRAYLSTYPMHAVLESTLIFLFATIFTIGSMIQLMRWFVNRQVVENIRRINNELKKNEDGDLENISLNTKITEFDELQDYINRMLDNIRENWSRLSRIIDNKNVPLGILEHDMIYKKTFVNNHLLHLLKIPAAHTFSEDELLVLVQQKLELIMKNPVLPEKSIYLYQEGNVFTYLQIEKEETKHNQLYYVSDVSGMWDEIESIRFEGELDSLVQLYNRRGFQEKVTDLFETPERIGYAVMIFLDADNLKHINDTYGHAAGDAYLKKIAETLQNTMGSKAICGRLGGDEFICFSYGNSSLKEIQRCISALKAQRGKPFCCPEQSDIAHTIEFSIGTAIYPQESTDFHELMRMADQNMYLEKKQRKANR